MEKRPTDPLVLADRVAAELVAIRGVVAVALGGSWARGAADDHADLDLGLLYDGSVLFDLPAIRALAARLDPRPGAHVPTDVGEWGPRIDGGAWLEIDGRRVDWLYRDLRRVEAAIDAANAGRVSIEHQPGHPAGFHSQTYPAEIALCRPLADPGGELDRLRAKVEVYPDALRAAILGSRWEAAFAVETARRAAARADVHVVVQALGRASSTLVWVLHALNRTWLANEKGALAAVDGLARRPADFRARVERILAAPGGDARALSASLEAMAELVVEVDDLSRR